MRICTLKYLVFCVVAWVPVAVESLPMVSSATPETIVDFQGCEAEATAMCRRSGYSLQTAALGGCIIEGVLSGGMGDVLGVEIHSLMGQKTVLSPSCSSVFEGIIEPFKTQMSQAIQMRAHCTPEMLTCGKKTFLKLHKKTKKSKKQKASAPELMAKCVINQFQTVSGGSVNIERVEKCTNQARSILNVSLSKLLDPSLRNDCENDILQFCLSRAPTSLDMHFCLIENQDKISETCIRHKQFLEELTKYSEAVDYRTPFWENCELEIGTYCAGESNPNGWEQCLKSGYFEKNFSLSGKCRESLATHVAMFSFNPEQNKAIEVACELPIDDLCQPPSDTMFDPPPSTSSKPGSSLTITYKRLSKNYNTLGRWIAQCLMEKKSYIRDKPEYRGCSIEMLQSTVISNAAWESWGDWNTTSVCEADAKHLCGELSSNGQGFSEVNHCLRHPDHVIKLSNECTTYQHKLMFKEAGEMTLKPRIAFRCAWAVAHFCASSSSEAPYACLQRFQFHQDMPESCRAELANEEETFSSLDLNLRCQDDISRLCPSISPGSTQSVTRTAECLFNLIHSVTDRVCRLGVLRVVDIAVEDITASSELFNYCQQDILTVCAGAIKEDVGTAKGAKQAVNCLFKAQRRIKNPIRLSQECQKSVVLFRKAATSTMPILRRTCAGLLVEQCGASLDPDTGAVLPWSLSADALDYEKHAISPLGACLFDALLDPFKSSGASEDCKREFHEEAFLEQEDRVLNQEMKVACKPDIQLLCEDGIAMQDVERIQRCMVDRFDDISDGTCRGKVVQIMKTWSDLVNVSQKFDRICDTDVLQFCSAYSSSSLRDIHNCLRLKLKVLHPQCREMEIDLMKSEALRKRLKPRVVEACASEVAILCSDNGKKQIKKQQGTMGNLGTRESAESLMSCLQLKIQDPKMSSVCRMVIEHDASLPSSLSEKLSEKCVADAERLDCPDTTDQTAIQKCLEANVDSLSEGCRKSQKSALNRDGFSKTLPVAMERVCIRELKTFCPKHENKLGCLVEQHLSHQYSLSCRAAVKRYLWSSFSAISEDSDIATNCKNVLESSCQSDEKKMFNSHSQFSCLLNKMYPILVTLSPNNSIEESSKSHKREPTEEEITCLEAFSSFTDLALRFYTPKADLTRPCDRAVKASCIDVPHNEVQDCLYRSVMRTSPETGNLKPRKNMRSCVMVLEIGAHTSGQMFVPNDETEAPFEVLVPTVKTRAPTNQRVRKPTSREIKMNSALNAQNSEPAIEKREDLGTFRVPEASSIQNVPFTKIASTLILCALLYSIGQHLCQKWRRYQYSNRQESKVRQK